ncbi:hypothetical protein EDB19DRAFT_1834979 [Suillus lakei]|nr:hypothetical protein EDB19DRAFT_1834979 [Suillus lakei]
MVNCGDGRLRKTSFLRALGGIPQSGVLFAEQGYARVHLFTSAGDRGKVGQPVQGHQPIWVVMDGFCGRRDEWLAGVWVVDEGGHVANGHCVGVGLDLDVPHPLLHNREFVGPHLIQGSDLRIHLFMQGLGMIRPCQQGVEPSAKGLNALEDDVQLGGQLDGRDWGGVLLGIGWFQAGWEIISGSEVHVDVVVNSGHGCSDFVRVC